MSESRDERVDELQMQQAFDEMAGRETPPDRTEEILHRAAAGESIVESDPMGAANAKTLLIAALLLLGVAVTIVAAVWKRGDEADENQSVVVEPKDPVPDNPQPAKTDLPKGTDPADLKVLRSAEAMLAAERRLAEMIDQGKIAGVDHVLRFGEINDWPYRDGLDGMPDKVRQLDGDRVLMLGFMLPLDEVEGMSQFLLVESLWSCCYGTPPNIHGIVRCRMPEGKEVDYQFEPVKIVGDFRVEATIDDGYCIDVYQIDVEFLEVLQ